MDKLKFQVESPLGPKIRTSKEYWKLITEIKHPSIAGQKSQVKKAIQEPEIIRQSKRDKNVYLYYRKHKNYWLCAVARHLNSEGYLITAYITDNIKAGEYIYEKSN